MNFQRSRFLAVCALLAATLLLAACPQQVTVAEINADPGRFANKEVTLKGTVVNSFGVLGQGAYELDDGTGKIWVLSDQGGGVPGKDARVRVAGRVATGVTFGGRSFGTVLRETDRKTDSSR
jgi:hypothetical protein